MKRIKNVFLSIDRSTLIRHYVFGVMIAFFGYYFVMANFLVDRRIIKLIAVTSMIFYPFSMMLYERVCSFILGDRLIVRSLFMEFIWSLIKMIIVFLFAVPFGGLYFFILFIHVNGSAWRRSKYKDNMGKGSYNERE